VLRKADNMTDDARFQGGAGCVLCLLWLPSGGGQQQAAFMTKCNVL